MKQVGLQVLTLLIQIFTRLAIHTKLSQSRLSQDSNGLSGKQRDQSLLICLAFLIST